MRTISGVLAVPRKVQRRTTVNPGERLAESASARPPPPTKRDKLLTLTQFGKLTPTQAEECARARGLRPLSSAGDFSSRDATSEPTWSLAMTLAWIGLRTGDAVMHVWDKARQNRTVWQPVNWKRRDGRLARGFDLRRPGPVSILEIDTSGSVIDSEPVLKSALSLAAGAFAELRKCAMAGKIEGVGVPLSGGLPRPISADEWRHLKLADTRATARESLGVVFEHDRGEGYYAVHFRSDHVMGIWPLKRSMMTAALARKCQRWLEAQMRERVVEGPVHGKTGYWREAQEKFDGLSRRGFDTAWAAAIKATGAESWSRHGRKRKAAGGDTKSAQ